MHRWVISQPNPAADSLSASLGVSPVLAQILAARGYADTQTARDFIEPRLHKLSDPFQLPSVAEAVETILNAVASRKRIVIYGDYDADGITSCALLSRVLRRLGGHAGVFLPNRMDEGYGLSADGVERCLATHQPALLISVDCGTASVNEIRRLAEVGVDTIVVDHHLPPLAVETAGQRIGKSATVCPVATPPPCPLVGSVFPSCRPLVNPKLSKPDSPWFHLSSVGATFKLCHALLKRAKESGISEADAVDLREFLDLVAVGTVADVVPLLGENRILVKAGLEQLARTSNPGLRELKRVGQVPDKPTPYHIGFRIGPRLNAAGRLGDAIAALEVLLTDDPRRAAELAEQLDHSNRERQGIELQMLEEARRMVESEFDLEAERVIVVAREGWHIGVIGIVAARLVQEFYRPSIVIGISDGIGKGSCRSIEGFHIVEALRRCANLLKRFGGHEMAAGLEISQENIPALRQQLNQAARDMIDEQTLFRPVRVEAVVSLGDLTPRLLDELEMLAPFGPGNPPPLLAAMNLHCRGEPRSVGKGHLKLWLADDTGVCGAIGFGMSCDEVPIGNMDVAFIPAWNEYQRRKEIQLTLKAIRPSEAGG